MNSARLTRTLSLIAVLAAAVPFALAQPPASPPPLARDGKPLAFAIVSVKPHGEGQFGRLGCNGDSCTVENIPLRSVIFMAYGLTDDKLLVGGPSWLDSDRFDVQAKLDPADLPAGAKLTFRQLADMLQPVLADRFQLKVHHETRTFPAYNIVVAKGGLKMKQSTSLPVLPPPPPGLPPPPPPLPGTPPPGAFCFVTSKGNGFRSGHYCTTKDMEQVFEHPAGRFLVDKTGLTAHYDFEFCYSNERTPEGDENYNCPTVFTALEEQMGLKLEPTSATFDVLVIDSAQKPSEN